MADLPMAVVSNNAWQAVATPEETGAFTLETSRDDAEWQGFSSALKAIWRAAENVPGYAPFIGSGAAAN